MTFIRSINPLLAPPRGLDVLRKYGRNPRHVPKLWAGAGDRTYAFDANMGLSDGSVSHTAAPGSWAQYGGADGFVDLGGNQQVSVTLPSIADVATITPQQARIDAVCVVDITAVSNAGGNAERLILVGSNDTLFAAGSKTQILGMMEFGGTSQDNPGSTPTPAPPSGSGSRYEILFTNEQNNIKYQYLKLWVLCSGGSPSITFKAFVAVLPEP